jgi:hypothetical protein
MAQVTFSGFPRSRRVTWKKVDSPASADLGEVCQCPAPAARSDRKSMFVFDFDLPSFPSSQNDSPDLI